MRNQSLMWAVAFLLFLTNCSQEMPVFETQTDRSPKRSHVLSLEEALARGECFQSIMDGEMNTRNQVRREIETVQCIGKGVRTRSGEASDTAFYLVNYQDSKGFVLLSADDRMLPVYAMSDEGSLNLNDTVFNEGLAMFFRQAVSDAANLSLQPSDFTPVIDPFDYRFDRTVKPKLPKQLRSVTQREPYNKYCFDSEGNQALVGCGPLAIGTVLAYYQRPEYLYSHKMAWDEISVDCKHIDFYRLLSTLGKEEYLKAKYGTSSTSCDYYKISTVFEKFGFEHAPLEPFDDKKAAMALETTPIVVYGRIPAGENKGAHLWVMDGYIRYGYTHPIMSGPEPGRDQPYFYFHCCWGWSSSNGYYYYNTQGILDSDEVIYEPDEYKFNRGYNYQYLEMIINIKSE